MDQNYFAHSFVSFVQVLIVLMCLMKGCIVSQPVLELKVNSFKRLDAADKGVKLDLKSPQLTNTYLNPQKSTQHIIEGNDQEITGRWSKDKANKWYAQYPFLYGCVYYNADVVNEIEMWQEKTFNTKQIESELKIAQSLGFNIIRVFLHDGLWTQDSKGFMLRLDRFLDISSRLGIKPFFVLFDSCWNPSYHMGDQPEPTIGVHNSQWVQSPGKETLMNSTRHRQLERYVKGVIGAFANDDRILMWDLWNEPSNLNFGTYRNQEPNNKIELVEILLSKVFEWCRDIKPVQPLTSSPFDGDWSKEETLSTIQKIQFQNSDVISFHHYGPARDFQERIQWANRYGRPVICTEWFARNLGSLFETHLPIAKMLNVAMVSWGFVQGRTQTQLPWDSWQRPYINREPDVWQHDIFHTNHTPYRQKEVSILKSYSNSTF